MKSLLTLSGVLALAALSTHTLSATTANSLSDFGGLEEPEVIYFPATNTFQSDSYVNMTNPSSGVFQMLLRYNTSGTIWWDGDRTTGNTDRQRAEAKTLGNHQLIHQTYDYTTTWMMSPGFVASGAFCHITQLKPVDGVEGSSGAPLITTSLFAGSSSGAVRYASASFSPANVFSPLVVRNLTYSPGTFLTQKIRVTTTADGETKGAVLVSLNGDSFQGVTNVEVCRPSSTEYYPKWGFYRGVSTTSGFGPNDYVLHSNVTANQVIAAPTFSPGTGTYNSAQNVTITTSTVGATISYTTDGSTPSETNGTIYSGPVNISATTTLNAIAYENGFADSDVTSATYTINPGASQVTAPSFSPVGGTYTSAQTVTISTSTVGATISYTTDGSTPSETTGTIYSGPINLSTTTTLNAIAYESGFADSTVTSDIYTINALPQVAAPSFAPVGGTYTSAQTVTITSSTVGATISYTTDGSTPSETAGAIYSGPINISGTTTLNAIAYESGFADSTVTSDTYTSGTVQMFNFEAENLVYTPSGATASVQIDAKSSGGEWLELAATGIGQSISYTIPSIPAGIYQLQMEWKSNTSRGILQLSVDGTNLGGTLDQYANPTTYPTTTFGNVSFGSTGMHTIMLTVTGKNPSSSNYQLSADKFTFVGLPSGGQVVAPSFTPAGGTYTSAQNVTITTPTGGAIISYTTDGSTPSETNGTVYFGPVNLSATTTLNAIAYESGFTDSNVTSATYTINPAALQVTAPSFSPVAGTYTSAQNVAITSSTGGATIRYTTDGSTPSETTGTIYTGPVNLGTTTTLTAIAYESGFVDSAVTSATYTIKIPQVAAPSFSPVVGTYTSAQNVTITTSTVGATISYTTDGSTPSETAGTIYSGPVNVSATTTLKAIAYESGFTDSTVTSATYTIGTVQMFSLEAENLVYTANGATASVQTDVNSSGGKWIELAAAAAGPSISYAIPSIPAGTYQLQMEWKGNTSRGILQLSVDGTNLGSTLDQYSAKQSYPTTTFGNVTFSSTGTHTIVLTVTGKNPSSSSYFLSADKFTFGGQVAAPSFSPVGGTYTSAQTVTITTAASGAIIRYTTDGSTPSETAGTIYSGPVSIGTTTTLTAIAYESGFTDSAVTSAAYTINIPQVTAPSFSPAGGTYTSAQNVAISTATDGAIIRYTTDGSTPSETAGMIYSGPVSIGVTATLNAIAYESGFTDSAVTSATYTINIPQVAAPSFSPAGGTYTSAQNVAISTATDGAIIRYTTDGSTPSEINGTIYSGPVSLGVTATLTAIAYESGFTDSAVTSAAYTINIPQVTAPSFSPAGGTYTSAQNVAISTATDGAIIRYTTDGSTPSETNGTIYSGPVSLGVTATLTAIAYESGFTDSAVTSAAYTINIPQVTAPSFSPAGGTYTSAQTVAISTSTGGAIIRYTTDGSTPSETAGTIYSGPVSLGVTATLTAIAYESGFTDSAVTSAAYTINIPQVTAPSFSPAGGNYTSAQTVAISTSTGGAIIRYTTDGSTPSETAGTIYSGPVSLGVTATLTAIAYESGFTDSAVTSAAYTISLPPPQVATPTFSPGAGTYTSAQNVTISTATGGATIRYTTDGSTPSETTGTIYSGPVHLGVTATLNAIAFRSGFTDSAVTSAAYTIHLPQVAAPSFSPAGGTYTSAQTVAISTATGGATIRYTTDGSTPSETAGMIYFGPVKIRTTTTLKAIAFRNGLADSAVTSATYTIHIPQVAAPSFSPIGGTYTSAQTVAISTSTGGSIIRYTTDGSTPSETAGMIYFGPVKIRTTTTLKAIAFRSGFTDSTVTNASYIIEPPPIITLEAESLATTTSGPTITKQSDPNASGGVVTYFNATRTGQWVQYTMTSLQAGTYQIKYQYKHNSSRGQHNLTIDGTQVGGAIDEYSTTSGYTQATVGTITLSAGMHTIRLTITGKNASSNAYAIAPDSFIFFGQ